MKYVLAQDKSRFSLWQIDTAVSSLLKLDIRREDIYVLLGTYGYSKHYKTLFRKYKGVNFIEYRATIDLSYLPAIKPYLLHKFFAEYTYLQKEQWFLMDCDVVLTKELPKFKQGKLYVSDCGHYLNLDYLEGAGITVEDMSLGAGVPPSLIKSIDDNIGGAQYVFDNIDSDMFLWIYEKSYSLKKFLSSKKAGVVGRVQVWTAEMWAMAYGFAKWGHNMKADKRLDFSFATDFAKDVKPIIHNAGVTGKQKERLFNKGLYAKSLPSLDLDIDEKFVSRIYYNFVKER